MRRGLSRRAQASSVDAWHSFAGAIPKVAEPFLVPS